ncbi:adenylate kinase 8 [Nomia melanderi]|uniref:adenylate kinase 8 n=1 Tax=Nomia melanderi TaxID=2448451 RepID=UPI003FCE210C
MDYVQYLSDSEGDSSADAPTANHARTRHDPAVPRDPLSNSDLCFSFEDFPTTTARCSAVNPDASRLDLPRTKKEARVFQRAGIIPTHVIQLTISKELDNWENVCTNDSTCRLYKPIDSTGKSEQHRYEKCLRGLKEAYASCLIEVEVGVRTMDELGKDCAKLAKIKRHNGAPSLFRIALIGSRGSGCTTLAKYLAERFNLVHVDYDYIAEQVRLQQNPLGELIRMFELEWGQRPKPEIRIKIVEKYIFGYECLKRGWVLTGYPKTVDDFKLLDLSSTPPNRVIFVEASGDVCRERLLDRRYNIVTGSKHDLSTKSHDRDCELGVHPRDYRLIVERDLQEFEENVADMMRYAGESAVKIDGNENEKAVREKVEACLMRPAPNQQLRVPKAPPEIDPMNIEFDPDDEPDSNAFNDPCAFKSAYDFL